MTAGKWAISCAACAILGVWTGLGNGIPASGASAQGADQMIDLGIHRLQMHREGSGVPVVVIDAGLMDGIDKIEPLAKRIAETTQVITYNRAGYGRSEPAPLPRDGGREAKALKSLLDKAQVPGPYVLVGHSLGALNVMIFAAKYPKDVAGMILLDPPPLTFLLGKDYKDLARMAEAMTARWQATADSCLKSRDPQVKAQGFFYQAVASEHREMFGSTAKQVAQIRSFGDIPLYVIAAGKPNPAFGSVAEEYQKYWIDQSHALAVKSTKGTFVLAANSTHYIYLDEPNLVVGDILSVVDAARRK